MIKFHHKRTGACSAVLIFFKSIFVTTRLNMLRVSRVCINRTYSNVPTPFNRAGWPNFWSNDQIEATHEALRKNIQSSQFKNIRPSIFEFKRTSEEDVVQKALSDKELVILSGMRESGKTAMCVKVLQNDLVFYINLKMRNPRTESEMFNTFTRQFADSYLHITQDENLVKSTFEHFGLADSLNHSLANTQPHWENLAEMMFLVMTQIRNVLDTTKSDQRLVIFIDEANLLYKLFEFDPSAIQTLFSLFVTLTKEFKRCAILLPTATSFFVEWTEQRTQITSDRRVELCIGDLNKKEALEFWKSIRKRKQFDLREDLFERAYSVVGGRMINLDRLAMQATETEFENVLHTMIAKARRELKDALNYPISFLHDRADWFSLGRGPTSQSFVELWNGSEMEKLITLMCESQIPGVVSLERALRVMERSVINAFIYAGILSKVSKPVGAAAGVSPDDLPVLTLESPATLFAMTEHYKMRPKYTEENSYPPNII
jgi:AAA+ ATPase superfamily predicted ATPase